MYGEPVANPGKFTLKVMYPAYYYSTTAPSSEAFKSVPTIPKQSTPVMKPLNVYTPPGYDEQQQYPLIVIMHGITDNENTWNERSRPNVARLFDNLITSKATKPFIAVFALGTVDNSTNGYYAFGAELTNDLLPFLEENYSIRKDRGSRAMAGFSFGGMQTLSIGLCAHLKEFAWFAGLNAAGPPTPNATDIAKYVAMQNPEMYPLYYLYIGVGNNDGTAKGTCTSAANGLSTKGPHITSANFSFQDNIPGGHDYPTAEVSLYNFLRMAFAPN
jgi:enterochelin esterase-like enzyme